MDKNGPIPMKLTVVDDGGSKVVSSTRVFPRVRYTALSHVDKNANTSQEGLATQNNVLDVSMKTEDKPQHLGTLPSVLDTRTVFMVNSRPEPVRNIPSRQHPVFVPIQAPPSGAQRLNPKTTQKRLQATSDNKLFLVGNSAHAATQTLLKQNVAEVQDKFLPHTNQLLLQKVNVPNVTWTVKPNLSQAPPCKVSTVKDKLSLYRQQQISQDAASLLQNIILQTVNGKTVPSSPNSSGPNQLAGSLPKAQQSCVYVKHIPNLLSNSRGKQGKQWPVVDRNPSATQLHASINTAHSKTKLGGNQPAFSLTSSQSSTEPMKQPNTFYLVSGPGHPPTLIPSSLIGPSMVRLVSNQNAPSTVRGAPQSVVGQVFNLQNAPKRTCTANTAVMQAKRTHGHEESSMQQPNKKSKLTNSREVCFNKKPKDHSEGVLPSMSARPVQHRHSAVPDLSLRRQVDNSIGSSSGSESNQLLGNCPTLSKTITMKAAFKPQTFVKSDQVTRGTGSNSNIASCPPSNSVIIYRMNDNQMSAKDTANHNQTMTVKTFVVTDKNGTTHVVKVPASTPASQMLHTLSNKCNLKKLTLTTPLPKCATNCSNTSSGTVVVGNKVIVSVKQVAQSSLENNQSLTETDTKIGADLKQRRSKGHDGTDDVDVKEGKQRSLSSGKVSKTNDEGSVVVKQKGSNGRETNSTDRSNIFTRSETRNQTRKRKEWVSFNDSCCTQNRDAKPDESKSQILDHNYSLYPECLQHNSGKKMKVTLPTVALKPLKLNPEYLFKTVFLSSECLLPKRNQAEMKDTARVPDSKRDAAHIGDGLNVEGSMDELKPPQKETNSIELKNEDTDLPQKMPESLTVSDEEEVELEPGNDTNCEDELPQTPEETEHLEDHPDSRMEIPSDLSLMSGKDRIKILRERMRRREREIDALTKKNAAVSSK